MNWMKPLTVILLGCTLIVPVLADEGATGELIFPLEDWHNHGSCIIECPNGDMLVCWFHGSGERRSDDVEILGARLVKQTGKWSKPFPMADTPEFPDTNCCMIIDQNQTLWLLWPTIQANLWESALMKIKTSERLHDAGGTTEMGHDAGDARQAFRRLSRAGRGEDDRVHWRLGSDGNG